MPTMTLVVECSPESQKAIELLGNVPCELLEGTELEKQRGDMPQLIDGEGVYVGINSIWKHLRGLGLGK